MKKVRFPAWLERRRYSPYTKMRIATGGSAPKVSAAPAASTFPERSGNVIPFGRRTLTPATADCPEVSLLVLPPRKARIPD
ncbi:hypothetical protein PQI07_28250 [Methylobacterium sp. 092160098-2]|uniref:hypothetical protein n=1 Tax=Methylobacterium sp. 092160098-2 TaxID=3025129 RepID=UPI002381C86E|nr:hypothetical protein [Methylobacterium sp. 092160098-2]MDE4914562.1 hypothetical protein [Methylobacterium sp. 092160098-2]